VADDDISRDPLSLLRPHPAPTYAERWSALVEGWRLEAQSRRSTLVVLGAVVGVVAIVAGVLVWRSASESAPPAAPLRLPALTSDTGVVPPGTQAPSLVVHAAGATDPSVHTSMNVRRHAFLQKRHRVSSSQCVRY